MLAFLMLVFGTINSGDLLQNANNPGLFKHQDIVASAKDRQDAVGYIDTLKVLSKNMLAQPRQTITQKHQVFQDYILRNFFIDGHKILVEYANKKTPSLIIQAYLAEVSSLDGVKNDALSYFERLAILAKNSQPSSWQPVEIGKRINNPNQMAAPQPDHINRLQELREVWRRSVSKLSTLHQGSPHDLQEAIRDNQKQAWNNYFSQGFQFFVSLDKDTQEKLLQDIIANNKNQWVTLTINMKEMFIPTIINILNRSDFSNFYLYFQQPSDAEDTVTPLFANYGGSKKLDPRFIDVLKAKNNLQHIDITGMDVDEDLISILEGKKNLKRIVFHTCQFDDQAVNKFLQILPTLPTGLEIEENDCQFSSPDKAVLFKKANS